MTSTAWASLRDHLGFVHHDMLLRLLEHKKATRPNIDPRTDEVEILRLLIIDEYNRIDWKTGRKNDC